MLISKFSFCPSLPRKLGIARVSPFHSVNFKIFMFKLMCKCRDTSWLGSSDNAVYISKKQVVPAVCHILNLSIQTNKFPTRWKIARVVPLYKGKGSKFESKNFRPVAILPILSKVLERAVFLQLVRYMDENRFFNPSHHAYRSFHSTTTAMLQMYDMWCGSPAWRRGS